MHISRFDVVPAKQEDFPKRSFDWTADTFWRLVSLDGEPVTGRPVLITTRMSAGHPRLVYIDGGWPTYETFVYHQNELVAHFDGHMAEKDR